MYVVCCMLCGVMYVVYSLLFVVFLKNSAPCSMFAVCLENVCCCWMLVCVVYCLLLAVSCSVMVVCDVLCVVFC